MYGNQIARLSKKKESNYKGQKLEPQLPYEAKKRLLQRIIENFLFIQVRGLQGMHA